MSDFKDLFSFAETNENKQPRIRGLSASSESSEIIEPHQFVDERDFHKDIGEIKYGRSQSTNRYIIPVNSILDPSHHLKDFDVEIIPVNEREDNKAKIRADEISKNEKFGITSDELKLTEVEEKEEKENREYEQKTGIKKKIKYVEKAIKYQSIIHYVYTKMLCDPEDQNTMRHMKTPIAVLKFFESAFSNENIENKEGENKEQIASKCYKLYELAERKEYEDVKGSVALRKNRINAKGEIEVINVGVVNYAIEQYKIAVKFALNRARHKYQEFVNALLETGDDEIVYRNTEVLQYTKTNKGFVFEFNKRLDSLNIYGKALQELRDKIRYNVQYLGELIELNSKYKPYLENEFIKKYLSDKVNNVLTTFKYFFQYLVGIAFPQSGDYGEIENKTIENLELRQHKNANFYLTPEMLNYVINELMLSKVSSETIYVNKKFDNYINNKLNKAFPSLEKEVKKGVGKTTKLILKDKIWSYVFNSFLTVIIEDSENVKANVKDTIKNIKLKEQELKDSKCESESKRIGKEGCIVEALTYILITIMDWNEFTEITKNEITIASLILSVDFFTDKNNQKELGLLYKSNTTPKNKTLNLLTKQLQEYELEINEKQLNYLGNLVEYIMGREDDAIWLNIMFYAHKF
jgi:hypothetical protein